MVMFLTSQSKVEERELIELAQFVINRRTENMRDELHNYLVEIGLYDVDQSISKAQIVNLIKKKFGFSDFPPQIVDSALLRLRNKNDLSVEERGFALTYRLHPNRKHAIKQMIEQHKELRNHFIQSVISRIEKIGSLSNFDKETITQSLFEFLGRSFNVLSVRFAVIMTKIAYEPKELDELLLETEILDKSFSHVSDENLRRDAISAFQEVLLERDEKISLFLYSISQSFVLLQILNVDPDCQALQKKLFLTNMTIFLDTNIIIDLLCEKSNRRFHNVAVRLINLIKYLKIKVYFTNRTFEELRRRIGLSNENMKQIGRPNEKKRRKLMNHIEDPFIMEYAQQLRYNPSLKWEGFIGRIRNFTSVLKRKYEIVMDKSDYTKIFADPAFQEATQLVSEADPQKSESLVEHDCFHLLLVDMLRSLTQKDGVPKYWFVTRDKSVCFAEQMRIIIEKKRSGIEVKPSSVLIDVWIHMISPFLSPKVATQEASRAFAEMFSTHFVPSFPRMRPKVLLKVLSPLLDQRDLDSYQIRSIASDIFLAEHLDDLMSTGELPNYINNKLMQMQEERHRKELEKIKVEKETLEDQLLQSEQETFELRSKIELRKQSERYLAGALVFLIVWASTYFAVLLPTVKEPFSSFIYAIIIALIFGYLLGFQRYEWILKKNISNLAFIQIDNRLTQQLIRKNM